MTDHIAGKVIIVTGAGSGFGRRVAERTAARGARLLCADINSAAAEAVAKDIRATGGEALAITADVTRIEDMQNLAQAALDAHGVIDVMVNNAGIMPLAFLSDHATALDAWNRCIDINFRGVMNGTIAVHDQMMAQGHGHIVNLSSIYGNHPVTGAAVYGATKAAVNYFSNAVRMESRGKIKVTVVKPTGVPTTGLGDTVVNKAGSAGILGQYMQEFLPSALQSMQGTLPPELADRENSGYFSLNADDIAEAIVHVIDQPHGVTLSDVTVRATGDYYIL
ncbi:MAG TPA: SDR family oxidoreductase [Sphingobium sp.]|uniref:SDR family oxidoreductase n=1 Tax=Sphingobium sp. TaxID=1912891 RepID=UPI002ED57364